MSDFLIGIPLNLKCEKSGIATGLASMSKDEDATELLRDLLIVQLGLAGVPRENIRKIARCNNNRVASVLRLLKISKKKTRKPH
jgi:hypothetical protein